MKKIFLLAPFDLFPPVHGGSTIVRDFIKHASLTNKVYALITHLHSIGTGQIDLRDENLKIDYCKKSFFDKMRVFSILFNLFYFKKACRIMKEFDADVIQCEILWTSLAGIFLKRKFHKPLVLVEHNVEYLKFRDSGKISYFLLSYLLWVIEKCACVCADKIVILSQEDRERLIKLYKINPDKIDIITTRLDLDFLKYREEGRKRIRQKYGIEEKAPVLVFVGNLKYEPNIFAVKQIVKYVYPVVKQKFPNIRLLVIGQSDNRVLKYQEKGIIFTGYLERDEMVDHLSTADVVVVPVDSGSGVRTKIIEAAACSRAVVSTRFGAEGLKFTPNKEIIITETIDSNYVHAVLELISNEEFRREIGNAARNKAVEEYSLESAVKKFEQIYEQLEVIK